MRWLQRQFNARNIKQENIGGTGDSSFICYKAIVDISFVRFLVFKFIRQS